MRFVLLAPPLPDRYNNDNSEQVDYVFDSHNHDVSLFGCY